MEILVRLRFTNEPFLDVRFGELTDSFYDIGGLPEDKYDLWRRVVADVEIMIEETEHLRRPLTGKGRVQNTMFLSTGHVEKTFNENFTKALKGEDAVSLEGAPCTIYKLGDVGYMINLDWGTELTVDEVSDTAEALGIAKLEEVLPICVLAWIWGCTTIVLDRDAPVWPHLPIYNW
jgi:hypothetical protein